MLSRTRSPLVRDAVALGDAGRDEPLPASTQVGIRVARSGVRRPALRVLRLGAEVARRVTLRVEVRAFLLFCGVLCGSMGRSKIDRLLIIAVGDDHSARRPSLLPRFQVGLDDLPVSARQVRLRVLVPEPLFVVLLLDRFALLVRQPCDGHFGARLMGSIFLLLFFAGTYALLCVS